MRILAFVLFALVAVGLLLALFEQPVRRERRMHGRLTRRGLLRALGEGGRSLLDLGWLAFLALGGGLFGVLLLLGYLFG